VMPSAQEIETREYSNEQLTVFKPIHSNNKHIYEHIWLIAPGLDTATPWRLNDSTSFWCNYCSKVLKLGRSRPVPPGTQHRTHTAPAHRHLSKCHQIVVHSNVQQHRQQVLHHHQQQQLLNQHQQQQQADLQEEQEQVHQQRTPQLENSLQNHQQRSLHGSFLQELKVLEHGARIYLLFKPCVLQNKEVYNHLWLVAPEDPDKKWPSNVWRVADARLFWCVHCEEILSLKNSATASFARAIKHLEHAHNVIIMPQRQFNPKRQEQQLKRLTSNHSAHIEPTAGQETQQQEAVPSELHQPAVESQVSAPRRACTVS